MKCSICPRGQSSVLRARGAAALLGAGDDGAHLLGAAGIGPEVQEALGALGRVVVAGLLELAVGEEVPGVGARGVGFDAALEERRALGAMAGVELREPQVVERPGVARSHA